MKTLGIFARIAIIIYTICSVFLLCLYCFALTDKIRNPEYKNLSYQNYLIIGTILIIFTILNVFLFTHFFKKRKSK